MYARVLASDAAWNGRFFTGVLTTGIYCLPSCKARKPKPDNVKFFPTCEAARAAGLRACRKCHPDDFARGADPVLEDIETLVAEVRRQPGAFADVRAVVRRSGFGATRLFELIRQHFHSTPADLLVRARVDAAKAKLLESDTPLLAIVHDVGFESASVFHEHFRRLNGCTPAAYRALATGDSFSLTLPDDFMIGYLKRALSRDHHSVTERLEGNRYTAVWRFGEKLAGIQLELAPPEVRVVVKPIDPATRSGPSLLPEVHASVVGMLGLDQDTAAFARLLRKLGLARLAAGRAGMRIVQTPSVFDGLLWSIIGQQINFAFACQLKRRLIERTSRAVFDGLFAPPTPAEVAALAIDDLLPLKFSRQKADYLISTARMIAAGELDVDALRHTSATRAERTLLAIHGLGPWSVNYVLMRALGFSDCVPLGDTGVTSGLQSLFKLEVRPDIDATRRLMSVFSPFRSLATAHLWQLNQPIPT